MRRLAWLIGALTLLATGSYTFVYLQRWEWHRALIVAVIFVAAEIAVGTALVLRKLGTPTRAMADGRDVAPPPRMVEQLHAAAPDRDHFGWLDARASQFGVFIPILLGGGVLVSAAAWAVERIAKGTAEPKLERSLAAQLSALQPPAEGLVVSDGELLASAGRLRGDDQVRLMLGPARGR